MTKEFYITIEDEDGNIICQKVPFDEERLEAVSAAAGGLQDFVREYKDRMGN